MAKPLTSWLVPSFSQHNLRLVGSGCCLHVSVTKFWDKFASLREVNSPNSWNKFQIIMLYRYVFDNISTKFHGISWVFMNFAGFHGFTRISRLRDNAKYQKPWLWEFGWHPHISTNKSYFFLLSVQQHLVYWLSLELQPYWDLYSCHNMIKWYSPDNRPPKWNDVLHDSLDAKPKTKLTKTYK